MKQRKLKIKEFWEFHNSDCWKIRRYCMVEFYLYIPTMRYIYKTAFGTWRGTKNPIPTILLSDAERKKIKTFENEDQAVRWLAGEKVKLSTAENKER